MAGLVALGLAAVGSAQEAAKAAPGSAAEQGRSGMAADKVRVLFVGESICDGYFPSVSEALKAEGVASEKCSGGDSMEVLKLVDEGKIPAGCNIVHLNCGLHDLRVDKKTGAYQQPIEKYRENMEKIATALTAHSNVVFIFCATTPVDDSRHNAFKPDINRYMKDVNAYNEVARGVMERHGIRFYNVADGVKPEEWEKAISGDGVHMSADGYKMLSEKILAALKPLLVKKG
jgi:hypothetical protein